MANALWDRFADIAEANSMDPIKQTIGMLSKNETSVCKANRGHNVDVPQLRCFEANSVCTSYLETQIVNGENYLQCRATLLSMFVVIRLAGLFALKRNVTK